MDAVSLIENFSDVENWLFGIEGEGEFMHRNSLPPELDPDPEQGQSPSQSLYTGLKQNIYMFFRNS